MCGESSKQIQRYIRLTELQPKLLDMVDNRRLNFTVAVDISYIDKESKVDIRNPPSLLAHERSRFATCQRELLTPTDISIPLTHHLVFCAFEAGNAYSVFKWNLQGNVRKKSFSNHMIRQHCQCFPLKYMILLLSIIRMELIVNL